MVSTHLFIETGQNLPLISHGGTSMLCTAAALGIILSISRQVNINTSGGYCRYDRRGGRRRVIMESIRLDKYLWAVRIFKTRSDAADAIRNNKVTVNGAYAKPSREVKIGERIEVRRAMVTYSYLVLDLIANRQPAKNVPQYCQNITPQSELDKLNIPRETIFVFRERGTGRPTKKERREIDALMDGFYFDDEDDE